MVKRARHAYALMLGAAALGGCAPVGPGAETDGLGLRQAYWRPEDRVLVTDFREVASVTADRRFVYAATANGVTIYDHRLDRWNAPLTVEDGFPGMDPPIAVEADEFAGVLWLATRTGALWAYDVSLADEWRWVGTVPGAPPLHLTTHEGTLWARTSSGWFEVAATGGVPTRATPPPDVQAQTGTGLDRLQRESAAFRSTGSSLTVDEWLRRYEITSAARALDPSDWWLGTWGGGVYAYDDRMLDAQPLRYGTVGRGVSAIAEMPDEGGFWFGADGMDVRRGVARADRALQRWAWHESGASGAPNGTVHDIADTPLGVFVAAQDGLFRLVGERWDRLTDSDALPSTTVRSLAWAAGALWAGTDRGVARIAGAGDALAVTRIDGTSGTRIHALAQQDSLLWIASDRGLWQLDLATGTLSQPSLDDPRLRGRIIGVAYDEPRLYALTESALLVHDGTSWSASAASASLLRIGRPTHVAARNGLVWVAATAGALGFDPVTGAETLLSEPSDIPEGPVRQVLPVAGGVWLATPAGALLVRFE